jgi:phosphatidylserine/phosphatidylglycerophosphate/cardiolipin synthase-like enzyme
MGPRDDAELIFLHPGAQTADAVLDRLVAFVDDARRSLDLAVYDAYLAEGRAQRLIAALDAAESRGVRVRAVYNDDEADRRRTSATPPSGPSLLPLLREAVPAKAIDGIPDLMHHKYVIRDGASVWTGSANWTDHSWDAQENVLVVVHNAPLAGAFTRDFEQLWNRERVEGSGTFDDDVDPLQFAGLPLRARALFAPGRGKAISQLFASRIGQATTRVRVCSPVITSTPILATLAEVVDDARCNVRIVVDGPMMQRAIDQWREDGRAAWKVPLFERLERAMLVHRKQSSPFGAAGARNYMHAKVVVCDNVTFLGSYNCSHSGELNAENVVEFRGEAFADRCADYVDQVFAAYSPVAAC